MIDSLLGALAVGGLPDAGGNLWAYVFDQAKQFWYIGVVFAGLFWLASKSREGSGHIAMKVFAAGILVFSTPGLGRFIGKLGDFIFKG
jgi:hypothetical protein